MKEQCSDGFQSIKPENIDTKANRSRVDKKMKLAKKILSGKNLTIPEKEDVFRYLTGSEPSPVKERGRKPTTGRDIAMAMDFLFLRKEINDTGRLMDALREYDEKRRELNLNRSGSHQPLSNNAIYSAVDRGVKAISEIFPVKPAKFIEDLNDGYLCDISDDGFVQKLKDLYILEELVEEYWNDKEKRRKKTKPKRQQDR